MNRNRNHYFIILRTGIGGFCLRTELERESIKSLRFQYLYAIVKHVRLIIIVSNSTHDETNVKSIKVIKYEHTRGTYAICMEIIIKLTAK